MTARPNILSIQSHVAYGHVGNAAAVFPLQRLGCDVWPVHTVQFSNHPGYGDFGGEVFGAEIVDACVVGLGNRGALRRCDAVLSGYMGSVETGAAILRAVERTRADNPRALYCCDPVMGDREPGVYVRPDLPDFIRTRAIPAATIVTPNQFELERLAGFTTPTLPPLRRAIQRLHAMGPSIVLATSVETEDTPRDALDVVVSDGQGLWRVRTPKLAQTFHGSGDVAAALFLLHRLHGRPAPEAMAAAVSSLYGVLRATVARGQRELALVAAQDEFVAPSQTFVPESLSAA